MPARLDAEGRAAQLAGYKSRLQNLSETPRLFFHPAADYGPDERLKPGVQARSGVQRNV